MAARKANTHTHTHTVSPLNLNRNVQMHRVGDLASKVANDFAAHTLDTDTHIHTVTATVAPLLMLSCMACTSPPNPRTFSDCSMKRHNTAISVPQKCLAHCDGHVLSAQLHHQHTGEPIRAKAARHDVT